MAKATKKVATKKTVVKKIPAKKVAAKKVAAKKAPAPAKKTTVKKVAKKVTKRAPITTVTATIDVGFGNALYIRGESAGLSWDKGVLMGNAAADAWVWSSDSVKGTLEFKLLINDETWSDGPNFAVATGETVTIEPAF